MVKYRNVEIRQTSLHEQVWVAKNSFVYVKSGKDLRRLPPEQDKNHDMIVRCRFFRGGWCYVGELMAECFPEKHDKNLKMGVYNNMKTVTETTITFGGKYVQIYNSESICDKYKLTAFELQDIFNMGLRRKPTPKTKMRDSSVKGYKSKSKKAEAREREATKAREAEKEDTSIVLPKTYVKYDSAPSINLGIKPKAHDEDNLEEE